MEITGVLWDSCPNGVDCEKTYSTDDGGVIVRLDRTRLLDDDAVRALGVTLPDHEVMAYIPAQQWNGGRP